MTKKKKIKPVGTKTNFTTANPPHVFSQPNQRLDQRNYRTAKINMPRRPK